MPQISSGRVLREARERKGYDLTTVARRLRIRPDILRAIESGDFSNMPPRGYTRNMVNAYARFLGLNPTEIVNLYLDEAYAHQVEKARNAAQGTGFVMEGGQRRPRLRSRMGRDDVPNETSVDRQRRTSVSDYSDYETGVVSRGTRHLYDDRTRYSHDGYGVTRSSMAREGRSDRDFMSHHSGYPSGAPMNDFDARSPRRGRRDIQVGQTPMEYSAPRLPAFVRSRGFLIGAIAAVLVIVIAVVFFVLGNKNQQPAEDVSQLPVSGISDTTGTSTEEAEEEAQVEIAPTSARVAYSVEAGDDCYVETYVDGKLAETLMISGPARDSLQVTSTWTITTWSPDTIEVKVDGEVVQLASNPEFGGMYSYTVDFPAILDEWNRTHGSKTQKRQAAVASAANAAEQASKSSSSSSDDDEDEEKEEEKAEND